LPDTQDQHIVFAVDDWDSIHFVNPRAILTPDNGILKISNPADIVLRSTQKISFHRMDVGTVEIRIKHHRGKQFSLGWTTKMNALKRSDRINVDTKPDGEFHTYAINVRNLMKRKFKSADSIKQILIRPSDTIDDSVEIDYIRFMSVRSRYRHEPCGLSYEIFDWEMRKCLYLHVPAALVYSVDLPKTTCWLTCGLAMLTDHESNTFSLSINGEEKPIHMSKLSHKERWLDIRVDLTAYAGRRVDISFNAECKGNNIIFLSNPLIFSQPFEKQNILFVLEDALRADHLPFYGYSRDTAPTKTRLKEKGVLFKNAFAQACKTRPSLPSIMTSLYPSATGVWNYEDVLHENYLTLAEILRHQGYITASFIQNQNGGIHAGLHQGFSYIFEDQGGRAKGLYSRVLDWISTHSDRNFFIYIHIIDPHSPYDPPEGFRMWMKGEDPERSQGDSPAVRPQQSDGHQVLARRNYFDPKWVREPTVHGRRGLYDGEILFNDRCFEDFINHETIQPLRDQTLLVFLSDHGEHLGEKSVWGHMPPGYSQAIQTPLFMIYPPMIPKKIIRSEPVQNCDIMPTVLDLAGIPVREMLIQGESLIPLIQKTKQDHWRHRLIFSEEVTRKESKEDKRPLGSLISGHTHVLNSHEIETIRFNIDQDMNEKDGAALNPVRSRGILDLFQKVLESNMTVHETITHKEDNKVIPYDPDAVRKLKALGYLQ